MAFTIKAAKPKKRGKAPKAAVAELCSRQHCIMALDPCLSPQCHEALIRQTAVYRNENLTASLAFDARCETACKLVSEIKETCGLNKFFSGPMMESKQRLRNAMEVKADALVCACTACLLTAEKEASDVISKKAAAIENRLVDLREYRAAHDEENGVVTKDYFAQGKYFTRQGTYRGHGAAALKPKLQMQNSYDVEALTTNAMVTKPIKRAPGDVPVETPPAQAANALGTFSKSTLSFFNNGSVRYQMNTAAEGDYDPDAYTSEEYSSEDYSSED